MRQKVKNNIPTSITEEVYIKATKRADRENEILRHGKLISTRPTRVYSSKRDYKRNNRIIIYNFDV